MHINKIKTLLVLEGDSTKQYLQGYDPIYAMSILTTKVVVTLEQLMTETSIPVLDGESFLEAAHKLQGHLLLEHGHLPDLLVILNYASVKNEVEVATSNNAIIKAIVDSGLVEVWEMSFLSTTVHSNGEKVVYINPDPNEEPIVTLLRVCRMYCTTSNFVLVTDPMTNAPLGAMRHYSEETQWFLKEQQCGILTERTADRLKEAYFAKTHGLVIINERDLVAYHTASRMRFEYRSNVGGLL